MRARVQVSTDVASLGIWDAGNREAGLEALAGRGDAVIVRMGRDCGGAVEVVVDEPIPADRIDETDPIAGERTVNVRSGEVVIDGIEYFDTKTPAASEPPSAVRLPNGTYLARVRVLKDEDTLPEPASEREIRRILGDAEVDYFESATRRALLSGVSTLLLLPVLLFVTRWFIAVPVTIAAFLAAVNIQHWRLHRNPRYQRLSDQIVKMRLGGERPLLVVQLTAWTGAPAGGPPLSLPETSAGGIRESA